MPRHRSWDEDGRVCANPECTRAGEKLPWSEFPADKHHASKHHPRCKRCKKQSDRAYRAFGSDEKFCKYCHTMLEDGTTQVVCDECFRKVKKYSNGTIYVIVACPDRVWIGGHLPVNEYHDMLAYGYFEPGTVVEEWYRTNYVGAYRISGSICPEDQEQSDMPQQEELEQGHLPKGDGVYLKIVGPPLVHFTRAHETWQEELDRAIPRATDRLGARPRYLVVPEDSDPDLINDDLLVVRSKYMYPLQFGLSVEEITDG